MLYGIELFLRFAVEKGAITREEAQATWKRAVDAITGLAAVQSQRQQEEDPVREALRLLKVADEAGELRFRTLGEDTRFNDPLDTPEIDAAPVRAVNRVIGWRKDSSSEWLCHPDWLWEKLIQLFAAQQRRHLLPDSKNELYRRMVNRGFLPQPDEDNRVTVKRSVGPTSKDRMRVIVLTPEAFDKAEQPDDSGALGKSKSDDLGLPLML